MAGRLLGYLFVCDPPQQTIDELGEALLASRSAITGAVKLLEGYRMVRRTRVAGERMDRVSLDPASQQPQNFDSAIHTEHAALFREGLALLADAPPDRRAPLEEMVALAEFLSERLPALRNEWQTHRDQLLGHGNAARSARSPAHPRAVAGRTHAPTTIERPCTMTDPELAALRERADNGSAEAADELIELATERGDIDELRRLSDRGNGTATDQLIELAGERGDGDELRRLADRGNSDAADQLIELATERGDIDELRRLSDRGNGTATDQLIELATELDDLDELRRLAGERQHHCRRGALGAHRRVEDRAVGHGAVGHEQWVRRGTRAPAAIGVHHEDRPSAGTCRGATSSRGRRYPSRNRETHGRRRSGSTHRGLFRHSGGVTGGGGGDGAGVLAAAAGRCSRRRFASTGIRPSGRRRTGRCCKRSPDIPDTRSGKCTRPIPE